ncbi:hypothetical protein AFLA70_126g002471 [Aspergillus flavus AF70]|nr:hypothetical protein AFLA70_126g002471 [Aspergillus flavus AF70]
MAISDWPGTSSPELPTRPPPTSNLTYNLRVILSTSWLQGEHPSVRTTNIHRDKGALEWYSCCFLSYVLARSCG